MPGDSLLKLKTPLNQDPNIPLHPRDKALLIESTSEIISDLEQLLNILESEQLYIKALQRKNLVVCIHLAQNLGFKDSEDAEKLVAMLNRLIRKNDHYIKKEDRLAITPFLKFLLDNFSNLKKINFNTKPIICSSVIGNSDLEENIIGRLDRLKISNNNSLPETFVDKLSFTDFDKMFNLETGGIAISTWEDLEKAGVWEASPDLKSGKIIVNGVNSEPKFMELINNSKIPKQLIEYHQEIPLEKSPRDDGCRHAGCKVDFMNSPDLFYDFRSVLTPTAKEILDKYEPSGNTLGGTTGLFMRTNNRHYLVTAAHNLFPELSDMTVDDFGNSMN